MFVFPGFNSNIEHRNKTYHIQTEVNNVEGTNRVNTLIYLEGRIFLSFSTELDKEDSINRDTSKIAIRKQHNRIIRDLISDQLGEKVGNTSRADIDFEGLYGKNKMFSCYNKCYGNALDTYKKLILVEEI